MTIDNNNNNNNSRDSSNDDDDDESSLQYSEASTEEEPVSTMPQDELDTLFDEILYMQETTNDEFINSIDELNSLLSSLPTTKTTAVSSHGIEYWLEKVKHIRSMAKATAFGCVIVALGNATANCDLGEDVSEQGLVLVSEKVEDNLFRLLTTGRDNLGSLDIIERRRAVTSLLKHLGTGLETLEAKFSRDVVSVLYRSILEKALKYSKDLLESDQTIIMDKRKRFDDLSFPYKVFLLMDKDMKLECNNGGYNNNNAGREEDWKTRSMHGHHVVSRSDRSKSSPRNSKQHHFEFNATRYVPHVRSDDDRGSRLSYMDVAACVDYAVQCLNDEEAMNIHYVERTMLNWLEHMCSRPVYLAELEEDQLGHILHELLRQLDRANVPVDGGDDGRITQESLLVVSICLGSMMHNCATRLGMSMHHFVRPVLRRVADWAENICTCKEMAADPSSIRRKFMTESDMLSVLPYMYLAATSLLAAHPEQCVPVLSDYGHSLLRLARRNYGRSTTSAQSREALTEYIGAHLLVAETSGKLSGLPEGDLGPLVPRSSPTEEGGNQNVDGGEKEGQCATLDVKTIDKLLEMLLDENVRKSLFGSSAMSRHDAKIKTGRKYGKSDRSGGATWTPLTRRQRRHFELMARLLRISQRLHMSEAEDRGHGDVTSVDTLELLVARAEEEMMRSSAGIEQGEIDIVPRRHDEDYGCVASPLALARSPWIRTVARHLYKLNPKLGASSTIAQNLPIESNDLKSSLEKILLELCPVLQGLVINESNLLEEAVSAEAKNSEALDSVRRTTVATLQFLCACVESFPRGECWASSTSQYWSTILDEGHYPGTKLANVLERHGSSPADAAAVIYLLGTTLEFHGYSAGDDEIQMWTIISLLKMTESTAIICSREGLNDSATFGSLSSMRSLRLAWQYVWKTLFRFDLRYSSYTSGAFGNNSGELVVQLLTQIIRYQCTDRERLFACRSHQNLDMGTNNHFLRKEQGQLWKLPVFEDASCLLSCAPFELITNAIRLIGFNDAGDVTAPLSAVNSIQMVTSSVKDRSYFVAYCLQFVRLAMQNNSAESSLRRSILPYVAICLAALIRDGEITSVSTYELDALNMFATTEDSEPMCYVYNPDTVDFNVSISINQLHAALWSESITPYDYLCGMDHGLSLRIAQGRGALLNVFLNAQYEREHLRRYLDRSTVSSANAAITTQSSSLYTLVFSSIKYNLDELLSQLKHGDGNTSNEETHVAANASNNLLALPQVTAYLSLILTCLMSSHSTVNQISQNICDIFEDTFIPALHLLVEKLPSLKSYPSDFLVVFNHLHGIVRVLSFISTFGGDGATIHSLFCSPGESLYEICKSFIKEYNASSQQRIQPSQTQHSTHNSNNLDDSDDDDDDGGDDDDIITVDARGAWACSSLMLIIKPSMESADFIANHLAWTGNSDPYEALVCTTLLCRKLVLLIQNQIYWTVEQGQDANEEKKNYPLTLCLKMILQLHHKFPPSSKHYMRGLGHLAGMMLGREYSECCPLNLSNEGNTVRGASHSSKDYLLLGRWTEKNLKFPSSRQVLMLAFTLIDAQMYLRKEFESSLTIVICKSFCHIDESIRSLACDLLGAALLADQDQNQVAYDVLDNALPDLDDRDEMVALEDDAAWNDAEASIVYNSIQSMGIIAGRASRAALARDMIWRLIDLATKRRSLLLPCYRACKRASVLIQHKSVGDMFDDMMPHLLVKWLESGRSLRQLPLLLMSPFVLEQICRRHLPIDLLSMLQAGTSFGDGESQSLNERVLTTFVKTVAQFLIPSIFLLSSDGEPINNDTILVDKVLCNRINDFYGNVTVSNYCTSLRCILLLHRKNISIVGRGHMELSSMSNIEVEEMNKCVSKQLCGSLTESIIITKYWLSSSQTSRQREESWNTISLLCDILIEYIENGTLESGELGFSLHSFIAIVLDPTNIGICSLVLSTLNAVLGALFSTTTKEDLVIDVISVLHKLSLALIQTHQRAYERLYLTCASTLRCLEYEQKAGQGLLSWRLFSESDAKLKNLIASTAHREEKNASEIMVGAYGCLEIIANSERIKMEDVLGAEDFLIRNQKEDVFRNVNEKYSILKFFHTQQRSTNTKEANLMTECEHFIRVLSEHPISFDEFESSSSYTSHDVAARLHALCRLEKALVAEQDIAHMCDKNLYNTYSLLLSICHSQDPEQSRVISSRCLGELNLSHLSTLNQEVSNSNMVDKSLIDPILSIKKTILTSVGQLLLSGSAATSLIAMRTAKALLTTPAGKEYWMALDGNIKALLSPFSATHDDGKARKEEVRVSDNCMERLKSFCACTDGDLWCWDDNFWTLDGIERSCELWIREVTSSIISCSVGEGSKMKKVDQDFFRICQGLCAKEASFAASIFPALIFHLLDSEKNNACGGDSRVRDVIMTNIAVGLSTSRMNGIISRCFARILSLESKHSFATQAITVVLNTVELLRVITESRFQSSSEEVTLNRQDNSSALASASSVNDSMNYSASYVTDEIDYPIIYSSAPMMNAFEDSEKWRGFPYGVVLRVSGLDVAQACLSVKRYYSALYYAEMSMNNLIGSGTFFEDVATNDSNIPKKASLCEDISGFGVLTHLDDDDQKSELVLKQALLAKDIIGRCLSELNAKDELRGVLSQGSALYLKQNLSCLLALDGCGIAQTHAGSSSGVLAVTSCLEDLGLHHIKRNYLFGVGSKMDRNDHDMRFLREKCFEDALNKTSQWDNSLLPLTNDGDGPLVMSGSHHHGLQIAPIAPSFADQTSSSFYESVYYALQSLAKNDIAVGLDYALHARRSVLADVQNLAGSQALSTGMVPLLTKLRLIGRLELLSTTLAGTTSLSFLLRRWGYDKCLESTSNLEALLMGHDTNFYTRDHVDSNDGSMFRSLFLESSVKEISLKILANNLNTDQQLVTKALMSHIYKSSSIYRELGHPGAAKVSLSSLRSLILAFQKAGIMHLSSADKLPLMLRLEDARCSANDDDLDGAIMTCKMIANHLIVSQDGSTDIEYGQIRADSLLLGGMYMAQNNVDSVETLSSFFEKAAGLALQIHKTAPTTSNTHRASIASFKLGEFAASLYNSIDSKVSSDAWRRRNITAQERNRELQTVASRLKEIQKKSRNSNDTAIVDLRTAHGTLSKEVEIDARERQSVEFSMHRYLQLAVESYCNALKVAPVSMIDVSKHVFKLISIWFKNCQRKGTQDIVNRIIKSSLSSIPSYRLVPLTYQLFSRIDEVQQDDNSGFQSILRDVVCKICSEHPYHGIVQLLALSNGQRIGGGVNGRQGNVYLENVGTAKVNAVNGIIQYLRKSSPEYVCAMLDSYETLMSSYMDVAELETSNIQKKTTEGIAFRQYKLNLDSCLSGRRGKSNTNFAMPAIITKPPPIRPDGHYGQGKEDPVGTERVVSFESTFDLTTGIHRPKIVICIGSKGGRFKQLVKGEDDLRQDAIMEQVFGTVNDLLRNESSSGINSTGAVRRLRLITYGVTPLGPTSGVLEWVDNTQCFGDFLADKGKNIGAHSKYYPGEWGANDCREHYRSVADDPNATQESKRQCYDKICDNFSPAFRFFFLENFKSSMEAWHTARTLYTRSCAVSSIVGHILGIGDRHTSNILVHTKTGEVVHIDFGIVFEQGKTLTTPEVVPFRLTRDMVDGMGPSGTDGVFSKASEATIGVMRNNADTLLTILSAVVSDPLYKWSLSPQMATQHQRKEDESRTDRPGARVSAAVSAATDENRNDAADRAIAKVHEKLQGYEDGTSGEHKTIAGQVKLLINEARDRDNLCVMFSGWAPWF